MYVTLDDLYDEPGILYSKQQAQILPERCYDDINMNSLTIPGTKQRLVSLGIEQSTRGLLWASAVDMQCLLLILRGKPGFVQDKIQRNGKEHSAYQTFASLQDYLPGLFQYHAWGNPQKHRCSM